MNVHVSGVNTSGIDSPPESLCVTSVGEGTNVDVVTGTTVSHDSPPSTVPGVLYQNSPSSTSDVLSNPDLYPFDRPDRLPFWTYREVVE